MHRYVCVVAGVMFIGGVACSDPVGPEEVTGTWYVQEVNGLVVPGEVILFDLFGVDTLALDSWSWRFLDEPYDVDHCWSEKQLIGHEPDPWGPWRSLCEYVLQPLSPYGWPDDYGDIAVRCGSDVFYRGTVTGRTMTLRSNNGNVLRLQKP